MTQTPNAGIVVRLKKTWETKIMSEQKLGNPAVVGLAGFGLTTLVLQMHKVDWMPTIGPAA